MLISYNKVSSIIFKQFISLVQEKSVKFDVKCSPARAVELENYIHLASPMGRLFCGER